MFRIFGPPGTGKTTALLNMVDDALQSGIAPMNIAFLAFSRKAANEAKERAAARFNLDPKKDLFYFRTLHSLALTCSDIVPEQVMQDEHYKELSQEMGYKIQMKRAANFDDDLPDLLKASDPILGLINLARMRKIGLREQYDESGIDAAWNTIDYVNRSLLKYKENMQLFDFTDMLTNFVKEGYTVCPYFDLCFVDEAQDLSLLQWDIAHLLDKRSDRMYCAGDDDQAIYRWAGADVESFISLEGGSETLSQSYRVPRQVHKVAARIINRVDRRFIKDYFPKKDSRGHYEHIYDIDQLDMSEGSWLILAHAGYMLAEIDTTLRSSGYLFEFRGHRSIPEKTSIAVNGWEQLRKGQEVKGAVAKKIYSFMSSNERVARGFKTLPGLEDTDFVTLEKLQDQYGLLATIDMVWHIAMDRLPEQSRAYIIALLRRGEKFNGDPRIIVSTIHQAKGGEADNVVLIPDLSVAAEKELETAPDDIHRLFYVAVTRTKHNLYIVEPENMARSYDI